MISGATPVTIDVLKLEGGGGKKATMMMMARGLHIRKLIYLFFYSPPTLSTCSIVANCCFATLPLNLDERPPFAPSSPEDVMHTATSLLVSLVAFLLFGFHSDAGAILPRQTSNASPASYNTRFPSVTWDNDQWRLTTTALDQGHYQSRQSVANGYIGAWESLDII